MVDLFKRVIRKADLAKHTVLCKKNANEFRRNSVIVLSKFGRNFVEISEEEVCFFGRNLKEISLSRTKVRTQDENSLI